MLIENFRSQLQTNMEQFGDTLIWSNGWMRWGESRKKTTGIYDLLRIATNEKREQITAHTCTADKLEMDIGWTVRNGAENCLIFVCEITEYIEKWTSIKEHNSCNSNRHICSCERFTTVGNFEWQKGNC